MGPLRVPVDALTVLPAATGRAAVAELMAEPAAVVDHLLSRVGLVLCHPLIRVERSMLP
jgi:hypothetical protein